ncbi:MAG: hypothetical protein ACXAAM_03755 [Candidatus Heimdallarchaeaceae archaeon]
MTEPKFFHIGQFFTKRAFLSTFFGAGLIIIMEFLLPWLGILQIEALWDWITPVTIMFTIAIILVSSALAKNVTASILLAIAAILSFYTPYSTLDYGFISVIIIYMVTAFFAGFFSTVRITGKSALLTIGIVMGLQGLIGAGVSFFTTWEGAVSNFHDNSIGIAHGGGMGTFPLYDVIVGGFSLIYMIVFIILSRRNVTVEHSSKKFEIIGQILIFLGIVGSLIFIVFSHETFTSTTAVSVFGETNTYYLNGLFAKVVAGQFMAVQLLNAFYILPIVGFVIGIGMALIVYQRANGTSNFMTFNHQGTFLTLNVAPFLIICAYSFILQNAMGFASYFYIRTSTWFTIFTEFTNLLLINMFVAYLIFLVITLIRKIAKK